MSLRAGSPATWDANASWEARWLLWLGFPALAAASVVLWFLPTTLATAMVGAVAVGVLLAIPLLWREGYTWIVLWLAPIAAFEPLPTQGLRIAKYVLLGAAIVVALAKRRLSTEPLGRFDTKALWPCLILLAWLWLRALLGNEPWAGAQEAARLTLVAGLVWLWLTEVSRAGARRYFLILWMAMAAFQVAVCIIEASFLGALRSYGTFPNANAMGSYLMLTGALCFSSSLVAVKKSHRWAFRLLLFAILFALYLTGSRAAWVAISVSFLVMSLTAKHWRSLAVGLAVLAAVGTVYFTSPVFRLLTQTALRFQTGLTHRPLLWEAADRAAANVPLWGYGLEATGPVMSKEARYPSDIHREILAPMMQAGNPHNYYRELLLETGLIGGLLFAVAVVAITRSAWRNRRCADRDRRMYALALLGITAGMLVHAYFERSLFLGSMSSAIFYWFLVTQAMRDNEPAAAGETMLQLT